MAIRIPFGIDPDEIWELDFCAEVARMNARVSREAARAMREAASTEKDAAARTALEESAVRLDAKAEAAQADLAGYEAGSGPVFRVGAIPGRRRAELLGRHKELAAMAEGPVRSVGMAEWSRDVVSVAVKGHRGLKTASGRELAFESTDGRPADRVLESYGPILMDLAWLVLSQQRLGTDAKNA